jgi:hypothetical protein
LAACWRREDQLKFCREKAQETQNLILIPRFVCVFAAENFCPMIGKGEHLRLLAEPTSACSTYVGEWTIQVNNETR